MAASLPLPLTPPGSADEASANLDALRASLGTAETRKHSEVFRSRVRRAALLRAVLAGTAVLRGSCTAKVEAEDGFERRLAETRLLALALAGAPVGEMLDESSVLVRAAPTCAEGRLRRAGVLVSAGRVRDAVKHVWFALLVGDSTGCRTEAKALVVLAKCQKAVGVVGVRLDLEYSNADNFDADDGTFGCTLDWVGLSGAQKEMHRRLLARIPATEPVALTDRQSRVVVLGVSPPAELQRLFSWVIPHRLAVASTPRNRGDILAAAAVGVRTVVTLTMEELLPASWFEGTPVRNVRLPMRNMRAPSCRQVDAFFIEVLSAAATEGEQVLLHCGGGKGRAGTVAAAYLMLFGPRPSPPLCARCLSVYRDGRRSELELSRCADERCGLAQREPAMSSQEAVELIRRLRPGSIESETQRQFLNEFSRELWRRALGEVVHSALPLVEESVEPLIVQGTLPPTFPRLIVICGIPGSGKSHLATRLLSIAPANSAIASQDTLGTRAACEALVARKTRSPNPPTTAIVDRVNLLPSDRAHWLAVAFKGPSAIVIHLSTPPHLAAVRAAGRVDHPTLSPLSAERVSLAAARSFVPAGVAEIAAGFAAVLTVPGAAAADESVRLLSQGGRAAPRRPPSLAKFPRTRHLLALGDASRDDLVMSAADAAGVLALAKSGTVTVEEKLDGANLGFSLDVATGALLVQNRSHYVTSASHAQFRSLGAYVRRHDAALRRILASGSVLYGEWLYARHSVRYSRLPSAFIAFDLMDRRSGRFLSRSAFREVLLGTEIAVVPEVAVDVSVDGLVSAVGSVESLYAAGEVAEGVVVRVDEDGWLRERVKVVRAGFIPGNEHWGRRGLERNGLTAAGASELYN